MKNNMSMQEQSLLSSFDHVKEIDAEGTFLRSNNS